MARAKTRQAGRAQRVGDVTAMLKTVGQLNRAPSTESPAELQSPQAAQARARQVLADYFRLLAVAAGQAPPAPAVTPPANGTPSPPLDDPTIARFNEIARLSPRMRQTLERLLAGDGEKQVAARLKVSPHTVHVYVKALYRHFEVSSRGELLSLFVRKREG